MSESISLLRRPCTPASSTARSADCTGFTISCCTKAISARFERSRACFNSGRATNVPHRSAPPTRSSAARPTAIATTTTIAVVRCVLAASFISAASRVACSLGVGALVLEVGARLLLTLLRVGIALGSAVITLKLGAALGVLLCSMMLLVGAVVGITEGATLGSKLLGAPVGTKLITEGATLGSTLSMLALLGAPVGTTLSAPGDTVGACVSPALCVVGPAVGATLGADVSIGAALGAALVLVHDICQPLRPVLTTSLRQSTPTGVASVREGGGLLVLASPQSVSG